MQKTRKEYQYFNHIPTTRGGTVTTDGDVPLEFENWTLSDTQASHSDFGEKNYEIRTNFTIFLWHFRTFWAESLWHFMIIPKKLGLFMTNLSFFHTGFQHQFLQLDPDKFDLFSAMLKFSSSLFYSRLESKIVEIRLKFLLRGQWSSVA